MSAARRLPPPISVPILKPIRLPRIVAPRFVAPPSEGVRELVRRVSEAVRMSARWAALEEPPPIAPVQLALISGFEALDPDAVDLSEKLADGSARWISPKQAAWLCHVDPDTICRRVNKFGIGVKIGGRYWIDRTRITGRV